MLVVGVCAVASTVTAHTITHRSEGETMPWSMKAYRMLALCPVFILTAASHSWAGVDHMNEFASSGRRLNRADHDSLALTCTENYMTQLDCGATRGSVTADRSDSPWVFILDFETKGIRLRDDLGYIDDRYVIVEDNSHVTIAVQTSQTTGGIGGSVVQSALVNWSTGQLFWTRTNTSQIKAFVFSCK
jgi:hypothetical protein